MGQHGWVMFVLLFGLLARGGAAFAQSPPAPGPVTVDQVVERAVADNPELRAMRAEVLRDLQPTLAAPGECRLIV